MELTSFFLSKVTVGIYFVVLFTTFLDLFLGYINIYKGYKVFSFNNISCKRNYVEEGGGGGARKVWLNLLNIEPTYYISSASKCLIWFRLSVDIINNNFKNKIKIIFSQVIISSQDRTVNPSLFKDKIYLPWI